MEDLLQRYREELERKDQEILHLTRYSVLMKFSSASDGVIIVLCGQVRAARGGIEATRLGMHGFCFFQCTCYL